MLWLPAFLLVLVATFMLLLLPPLIDLEWSVAAPILLSWAVIMVAAVYAVWPLLRRKLTREEASRLYDIALYLAPSMIFALQLAPDMNVPDVPLLVGLTIYSAWVAWLFVRRDGEPDCALAA